MHNIKASAGIKSVGFRKENDFNKRSVNALCSKHFKRRHTSFFLLTKNEQLLQQLIIISSSGEDLRIFHVFVYTLTSINQVIFIAQYHNSVSQWL